MRRIALALATLAAASSPLAGCSDGSTSKTDPTTGTTVSEQTPVRTPEDCLRAARLDRVEQRDPGVWLGFTPGGMIVAVESVGPGIAINEAKRATEEWAYAAGPYFVHGPARAADGSFTTKVANCLRVGRAGQ